MGPSLTKRWLEEQLDMEESPEVDNDQMQGLTGEMGGDDYTGISGEEEEESPDNDEIAGLTGEMAGNAQMESSESYEEDESPEIDDDYVQGEDSQYEDYIGDL